ncbi:MAG: hypothetical protein ABSH15_02815 [Verrucomicrobiota bacterium]
MGKIAFLPRRHFLPLRGQGRIGFSSHSLEPDTTRRGIERKEASFAAIFADFALTAKVEG